MTINSPTFNVEEFELRGQVNPYLTEKQAEKVETVETRVNDQLNWLGQLLGFRGSNYWDSLVYSVDQKRQLLGGFGGVYNSFTFPKVLEVRNWSNQIIIEHTKGVEEGQTCYLNDKSSVISAITEEDGKQFLSFEDLPEGFFEEFESNAQLKVDSTLNRPEPFVRDTPGVSGDTEFSCEAVGSTLNLYPGWDVNHFNPYAFNYLIIGSRYYFDKPVYFSTQKNPFSPSVETQYDPDGDRWFFDLPITLTEGYGVTGYLVWPYSDPNTQTDVFREVTLYNWVDPSDWKDVNILENFSGVWGNKGGALPFNFCFDSLSIHGFNETQSVYLGSVERTLQFNDLLNLVYYGTVPQTLEPPGDAVKGTAWWSPNTGDFAVFSTRNSYLVGDWVEVDYRKPPEPTPEINYTYATVADFALDAPNIPTGSTVKISDVTGLQADGGTYQIQGIAGQLPSSGSVIIYLQDPGILYIVWKFFFADEAEFQGNALYLPNGTKVELLDSLGLKPEVVGQYDIFNLEYEIVESYAVSLTKQYSSTQWALSPANILKFIANTRLYDGLGDPEDGEMWWDFANPDAATRAAFIWYDDVWVNVNKNTVVGSPPGVVDYTAIGFYLNGELITPGTRVLTKDFNFGITLNSTGGFDFLYEALTFEGRVHFPTITVADNLTSAYRVDISPLVFSGIQYYMSPNVLDSETPLRVWKETPLQVGGGPTRINDKVYQNPLIADENSGVCDNWSRIFFRLPPSYERSGRQWSQVELLGQDFTYYGSTLLLEKTKCPPKAIPPKIYDELVIYPPEVPYEGVIYDEPYLYSNVGTFSNVPIKTQYGNAMVMPASADIKDSFAEASINTYDPLHERRADVTSPVLEGYGDWEGQYLQGVVTSSLSGFTSQDIKEGKVIPIDPPVWDASIYKYPTTCEYRPEDSQVDMNLFKVGYAYFAADMSAAEDGFFDVQQEISWRDPEISVKTGYVVSG